MRPTRALFIAMLFCSTASAIELSLVGNGEDADLTIGLSETGTISIRMALGADDGDVASAQMYFDQFGVDSFDVVNAIVGAPWRANREGMEFPLESLEDFIGSYGVVGLQGPWEGDIDLIILHGTAVGETDVYFEGPDTGGQRPPAVFDTQNRIKPYSGNRDMPGFIHFRNGWRDEGMGFDRPFPVMVVPEPSTVGMLLIGGAVLLVRRRRS